MQRKDSRSTFRLGFIVFFAGTLSNIIEFVLATTVKEGVMLPLIVLMLADASMIAYFFMHVVQIWRPEE